MNASNKRIGLALSGGGFRACIYHLGLIRFLRDAGILSQVTHVTSVSGGSVLAAHLLLNWDRYNGSGKEFDAAAQEVLSFVQLDVRNRVVRRFPLALPMLWAGKLIGRPNRMLTRTGLLEYHYQRYLYGDTSLFELPKAPQLHILSTNLSEGTLCSFHRNGLLMMKRQPNRELRFQDIHTGLATVAMAVTASSAFTGFFAPLELTGADVGANAGEFGRQAFTDGGVFDNLAVRMFRLLDRRILSDGPLTRDDFYDFGDVVRTLRQASEHETRTPLHRLAQLVSMRGNPAFAAGAEAATATSAASVSLGSVGDDDNAILPLLWDLLSNDQLQREPLFADLQLNDPEADAFFHASRAGARGLDVGDQLWLNRYLLESAYHKATGKSCFRRLNSGLDGVVVSDVGKPIKVQEDSRAGGLISTSLRASEILMDRVWQLENEKFHDTPGFVFARMTDVVEPDDDPTAMNSELQRQAARIRTDMDRFSPLEISSLIRHGYSVGRKACRARPELFGADLPTCEPWDPMEESRSTRAFAPDSSHVSTSKGPSDVTSEARQLQRSGSRRVWSTLLDYRDWISYVYVPIIVPLLFVLPYFVAKAYQRSHRMSQIIDSLSQGSRDLDQMSRLLEHRVTPFTGVEPEEEAPDLPTDSSAFEVMQDSRILDFRGWTPSVRTSNDPQHFVYVYKRLKVLKVGDDSKNQLFHMRLLPTSPHTQIRFPAQSLEPRLLEHREELPNGEKRSRWTMVVDFSKVLVGDSVDLVLEFISPAQFLHDTETSATLVFDIQVKTAEVMRWILLPEGKEYRSFRLIRYPEDNPSKLEPGQIATEYLADDSTILAYKLLSVNAGLTYELTWFYK